MKIQGGVTRDGAMLFPCHLFSESLNISSMLIFELDTGAYLTTILDSDVRRLGLDYSTLTPTTPAYGIGGKSDAYAIEDAVLRFSSVYGEWSLERPTRITALDHKVEEIEEVDTRRAILACPSLMGRDILGNNFSIARQETIVILEI